MAFLALPAAWCVQRIGSTGKGVRVGAVSVPLFLAYLNIGLSWNYLSPWDGPEWTMQSVQREYGKLLP